MTHQPTYDVFLAHNSQDKPEVREIAARLKQQGLEYWLDEEQIPPGRWFQDIIQQAIPNVKSAAILIGPRGIGQWQAVEVRSFISQCVGNNIPVIPVLLPGVQTIPSNLLFLRELNYVRFLGILDELALKKLVWGITQRKPDEFIIPEKYTRLDQYLESEMWQEADRETAKMMLQTVSREKNGWLGHDHMQNFPCEDLLLIDQLWRQHSNGRFGFRVQKQIWQQVEANVDAFGDVVGWKNGIFGWRDYHSLTFKSHVQEGHLPNAWTRAFGIRAATEATLFRGLVDAVLVRSLVERLVTCGKHIN